MEINYTIIENSNQKAINRGSTTFAELKKRGFKYATIIMLNKEGNIVAYQNGNNPFNWDDFKDMPDSRDMGSKRGSNETLSYELKNVTYTAINVMTKIVLGTIKSQELWDHGYNPGNTIMNLTYYHDAELLSEPFTKYRFVYLIRNNPKPFDWNMKSTVKQDTTEELFQKNQDTTGELFQEKLKKDSVHVCYYAEKTKLHEIRNVNYKHPSMDKNISRLEDIIASYKSQHNLNLLKNVEDIITSSIIEEKKKTPEKKILGKWI